MAIGLDILMRYLQSHFLEPEVSLRLTFGFFSTNLGFPAKEQTISAETFKVSFAFYYESFNVIY